MRKVPSGDRRQSAIQVIMAKTMRPDLMAPEFEARGGCKADKGP